MAAAGPKRPQGFSVLSQSCQVRSGYEVAIAAVLGAAADAIAAENFGAAAAAIRRTQRESDGGRASILLGDWPAANAARSRVLPNGALWATELVTVPDRLRRSHHGDAGRCGGRQRHAGRAAAGLGDTRACAR